jgi:hypothetical protein
MGRIGIVTGALWLGLVSAAAAQDNPRVVKLTVSPAPASTAPMPYPLLPQLRDVNPGNAAVSYLRGLAMRRGGPKAHKEEDELLESLDEPWSPETAKKHPWIGPLGAYPPLIEIDFGARCAYCDWQLLERKSGDEYLRAVDDIQNSRPVLELNSVRIRSAVFERDFGKAAHALQTTFSMARHVGEAPNLIAYAIGNVVARKAVTDRLPEWIAQPDAPSLFWALTDLPEPLIDFRRPLQSHVMDSWFPEIRQALQEKTPRPIPLDVLEQRFKKVAGPDLLQKYPDAWKSTLPAIEPQARAFFAKKGLAKEAVDPLPAAQLALMYLMAQSDLRAAEFSCVQNLPYWQARPILKKWRDERKDGANLEKLPEPLAFHEPGLESISVKFRYSLEREIALLRHVEALRLYAAQHPGQWPDSLADLRELPLPVDPFTGKGFTYRRDGKTAIVEAPRPPGMPYTPANWVRYELTLRDTKAAK